TLIEKGLLVLYHCTGNSQDSVKALLNTLDKPMSFAQSRPQGLTPCIAVLSNNLVVDSIHLERRPCRGIQVGFPYPPCFANKHLGPNGIGNVSRPVPTRPGIQP